MSRPETDQEIIDQLLGKRLYAPIGDLAGQRVVIYGAGGKARSLAQRLRGQSLVVAFIDKNAAELRSWLPSCEAPVLTPEEWDDHPLPHDAIAIAVHNFATDLTPIAKWAANRFSIVLSMADLLDIVPGWEGPHYWAAPRDFLERHRVDLARALSRFEEPKSRMVFIAALRERLGGIHHPAPPPNLSDQYAPLSLPALGQPLRVVDCGAFNGDSLLKISSRESIESIAAFEPDKAQIDSLRHVCGSLVSSPYIFQAGAWSCDCSLRFDPIGPGSGAFTEFSAPAEQTIPAYAIDSLIERKDIPFFPNFIKMDIEGAEQKALIGAQNTIKSLRPSLALSAYHQPADLWALSDWIANQELGYRFYLRSHGYNGFDLVLYARAN